MRAGSRVAPKVGGKLAQPEYLAEGHGDLAGLQVEGNVLDRPGQYLVPDHIRRTQGRVAGERYFVIQA